MAPGDKDGPKGSSETSGEPPAGQVAESPRTRQQRERDKKAKKNQGGKKPADEGDDKYEFESKGCKLFDPKTFRVQAKELAADATPDQLRNYLRNLGDSVAVSEGGEQVQGFVHYFVGIMEPPVSSLISGMSESGLWDFLDGSAGESIWPTEHSKRFVRSDTFSITSLKSTLTVPGARQEENFIPKFEIPHQFHTKNWGDEARELDRMLYGFLLNQVKGHYHTMIRQCGHRHSYAMAVCLLYREVEKAELPSTLTAIDGIMDLKYKGDPIKFETEAKKAIEAVSRHQISQEMLIVSCIYRAFPASDSISMMARQRVGDIIKSNDINKETPLFDIVASVCELCTNLQGPKGPSVNNIQTEDEVCQRCFKPKSQHHTQEINGRMVCVEWYNKAGKELRDIPKEYSGPKPPWQRENYVPRPKGKGGGKGGDRFQPRGGKGGAQVNNAEEKNGEETEDTGDGEHRKMSEEELHAISSVACQQATKEIWERIHAKPSSKGIGMVRVAKSEETLQDAGVKNCDNPPPHDFRQYKRIVLSICGGIEMPREAANQAGLEYDAWVGVEIDEKAREMALYMASKDDKPSPIYAAYDIYDLTEDKIKKWFAPGSIVAIIATCPCQDFSKLRLLPREDGKPPVRPGLSGVEGKKTLQLINIHNWVNVEHSPQYIYENVDWRDHKDFEFVKKKLGKYELINSINHGFLHRLRTYFKKAEVSSKIREKYPSLNPYANEVMDVGRSINVEGGDPTLTASYKWKTKSRLAYEYKTEVVKPQHYVAWSERPLRVNDALAKRTETVRVHEAERLMGLKVGSTAAPGFNDVQRLRFLGNGVCIFTMKMLFEELMEAEKSEKLKAAFKEVSNLKNQSQIQEWLVKNVKPEDMMKFAQDVTNIKAPKQVGFTVGGVPVEGTAIDSGASADVFRELENVDESSKIKLVGFDGGMVAETEGTGDKIIQVKTSAGTHKIKIQGAHLRKSANRDLLSMGNRLSEGFGFYFGPHGKNCYCELPDGRRVKMLIGDDQIPILPHDSLQVMYEAIDSSTTDEGNTRERELEEEMARLNECEEKTWDEPTVREGEASMSRMMIKPDAIINVEAPSPSLKKGVAKVMNEHSAHTLHDVFCGCSPQKLYKTLQVTRGFKAEKLPFINCPICPLVKQVRTGDRNTKSTDRETIAAINEYDSDSDEAVLEAMADPPGVVKEESHEDSMAIETIPEGAQWLDNPVDNPLIYDVNWVPTAEWARDETVYNGPRFGDNTRPMEHVFVDNKDYSQFGPQAGGVVQALVMYDYGSTLKMKVDQPSKEENGKSLKFFAAEFNWRGLPYKVTVHSDSCGSMKHIKEMCAEIGVAYLPLPPHHPNLNEAEKVCNYMWAGGRHNKIMSNCPNKYAHAAIGMAMHHDMFTATTASRQWKSPYEIVTKVVPSIQHLCRFWTKAYVKMPKKKAKEHSKRHPETAGEIAYKGRVIGYHHWNSKTKTVLIGDGRVVNSIDVTLDHNDFRSTGDYSRDFTYTAPKHDGALRIIEGEEPLRSRKSRSLEGATPHTQAKEGGERENNPLFDTNSEEEEYEVEKITKHKVGDQGEIKYKTYWKGYGPEDATWEPQENVTNASELVDKHIREYMESLENPENPDGKYPEEYQSTDSSDESKEEEPVRHPTGRRSARAVNSLGMAMKPPHSIEDETQQVLQMREETEETSSPHSRERIEFINTLVTMEKLERLDTKFNQFELKLIKEVEKINKRVDEANLKKETEKKKEYDHGINELACQILGASSMIDMNWNKALKDPIFKEKAIEALDKEKRSLCNTILERMSEDDDDWEIALKEATPGRYILTIKRNGIVKARGVKQGFKEDKTTADGADFNYSSHVAKFNSIRMALFQPNRGTRCIATKDISVAFLQSKGYEGFFKYICFKDPVSGKWEYYRQSGPIYGEASAPVRWEDTFGEWLEHNMKFVRGDNEKCVYYYPQRDLIIITYVDDVYADGERGDIEWFFEELDKRFECKDAEWLTPNNTVDHLGMEISMTQEAIYLCMYKYILDMLQTLDYMDLRVSKHKYNVPINKDIDAESLPLSYEERKKFMKGVGMLGWLKETGRPDVAYTHSRIAQHMANPTESAMEALKHCCGYLKKTAHLALKAELYQDDEYAGEWHHTDKCTWRFYSDSDFAGNSEAQNKRRSQNGEIAVLNKAPVAWASKVSSVGFAHPDIGEAHADMSSAAAEIYAASNACCDFVHLGYVADEMGIDFPKPFKLEVDNQAAEIFINDTAFKSKLKHIDCRQEWVKILRDKSIMTPAHVDTKENLADLFTKILDRETFTCLRDEIMHPHPAIKQLSACNSELDE